MKRLPHKGLTSPHTITVPLTTHAAVEAASQATGISSSALYSLGGEIVAAILGYKGDEDQVLDLITLGSTLANLANSRDGVWWALDSMETGANQ